MLNEEAQLQQVEHLLDSLEPRQRMPPDYFSELFAQIPVGDIASKLGADQGEVDNAIKTLVPALVGGLAQNVQSDDIDSSKLESAVAKQGASGLLDGGVDVDQVDQKEGDNLVASLFGGNDSNAVASALGGTGAGGSDLIKKLLPILAPIVLAYIGKQLTKGSGSAPAQPGAAPQAQSAGGGGLGDILGSILAGIAMLVLPAAAFAYRITVEEAALLSTLGEPYARYMRRTWRLIPYLI